MNDVILSGDIEFNLAFKPVMLLTIYETATDYNAHSNYYIERRVIDEKGKLSEAAPLKEETMMNIAKTLSRQLQSKLYIKGIIHPRILTISVKPGEESITWLCPASKKSLFFTKNVGLPDGEYSTPNLVFKVDADGNVNVWAVESDKITLDTKLFKAPFPNISGGNVCMGNAQLPWNESMSDKRIIKEVEERFFGSKFSHCMGKDSVVKGDYIETMKSLNGSFPNDLLIKTNTKLKDAIKE